MKAFKGYEAKVTAGQDKLPVGNYPVRIISAEEQRYDWGNVLVLKFDIADGDYIDYYTNRYNRRQSDSEKYKGFFRVNIPTGDGSDKDKWNVHRFNNIMGCLERDNPGFKWNWDEKRLSGLKTGMVFRSREWAYDGNTGFYTEPYAIVPISMLEQTNTPKPKMLTNEQKLANGIRITMDTDEEFDTIDNGAGDLPF